MSPRRSSLRSEREKPTYQCELAKQFVVTGHLSLSLAHFDLHLCLPISSCRKHLWKRTGNYCRADENTNICTYKLTEKGIKGSCLEGKIMKHL